MIRLPDRLAKLEGERKQAGGFSDFFAAIAEAPDCPHTASNAYTRLMKVPGAVAHVQAARVSPEQAASVYRELME